MRVLVPVTAIVLMGWLCCGAASARVRGPVGPDRDLFAWSAPGSEGRSRSAGRDDHPAWQSRGDGWWWRLGHASDIFDRLHDIFDDRHGRWGDAGDPAGNGAGGPPIVAVVPLPPGFYLLGGSLVALGALGLRRRYGKSASAADRAQPRGTGSDGTTGSRLAVRGQGTAP
jgi:hypothetical protein